MASCFKLYNENLVDQSTISVTSESALFPSKNLKDPRRSKVFRTLSSNDNVVFDFQETSEIDGIFLVSDKRAGFGVSTVTVEFNATDNWASPPKTVILPFSTELGIGHITFEKIEYRFARVIMTSTLGYCEISKIFIGKEMSIARGINFGWSIKDDELSTKQFNRYGQMFTDIILRQKTITVSFKNVDKNDMSKLFKMLDRVGESKPVYIAIGDDSIIDDYRRFSGPVFINDTPSIVNSSFARYGLSLTLKEVT